MFGEAWNREWSEVKDQNGGKKGSVNLNDTHNP